MSCKKPALTVSINTTTSRLPDIFPISRDLKNRFPEHAQVWQTKIVCRASSFMPRHRSYAVSARGLKQHKQLEKYPLPLNNWIGKMSTGSVFSSQPSFYVWYEGVGLCLFRVIFPSMLPIINTLCRLLSKQRWFSRDLRCYTSKCYPYLLDLINSLNQLWKS